MIKIHFVQILITIFIFVNSNLCSQIDKAKLILLDIDQGLSQNDVTYVLQDSRGFMWFATYSGLNRYDGYNFKIYKSVQDDSSSLRSNKIITLFEDHNGVLWVGTFGGGLSRFNRQKENFTAFTNNPDDPYSLPDNSVQTIFEDHKHRLWVGTKMVVYP